MISDPYQVLGVASGASDSEIKKAYRDKMRRLHPDLVHGEPKQTHKDELHAVQEAYEILSNPLKRQAWDENAGDTIFPEVEKRDLSTTFASIFGDGSDSVKINVDHPVTAGSVIEVPLTEDTNVKIKVPDDYQRGDVLVTRAGDGAETLRLILSFVDE